MIEIRINRDPREYKDKVIAGLTIRQIICVAIMLVLNIPIYIFGNRYMNKDVVGYILILVSIPLVLIGFFEYNKMPFERVILSIIQTEIIQPVKRNYANKNVIQIVDNFILKDEIISNKKKSKNNRKSKAKRKFNKKK